MLSHSILKDQCLPSNDLGYSASQDQIWRIAERYADMQAKKCFRHVCGFRFFLRR